MSSWNEVVKQTEELAAIPEPRAPKLLRDVLPWARWWQRRCPAVAVWGRNGVERARCDLRCGHGEQWPHVAERGMDLPAWRHRWRDEELSRDVVTWAKDHFDRACDALNDGIDVIEKAICQVDDCPRGGITGSHHPAHE